MDHSKRVGHHLESQKNLVKRILKDSLKEKRLCKCKTKKCLSCCERTLLIDTARHLLGMDNE